MIILNLVIRENGKIKEVRPFKSQFRLINFIKILIEDEMSPVKITLGESNFRNENITDLICDNPEIFRGTKYEGTRLFISELTD